MPNGFNILLLLVFIIIISCSKPENEKQDVLIDISESERLPEKLVAFHSESGMSAQYIYPTNRYDHGILGDEIEGGALLINYKEQQYIFELDSSFVFEDLQPRLVDLDNDGIPEIITILTKIGSGASISIYKLYEDEISVFASGEFIGTSYRWLNIAAIDDLDNNGEIEIAYVTTPHIGGNLHIAYIDGNQLKVKASISGVSNHKIRSRNLCLSVITYSSGLKTLYVPNNDFDRILGFQWENQQLITVNTIEFFVDPLITLSKQYDFDNLQYDLNCINAQ